MRNCWKTNIRYSQLPSDEPAASSTNESTDSHREPQPINKIVIFSAACLICLIFGGVMMYMTKLLPDYRTMAFESLWYGPVCSARTNEYDEYVIRHRQFVEDISTNCSAVFDGDPPRVLVHDCTTNCSGLGDRIGKMAGFFQFALLTNRFLFINQHNPNVSDWLVPIDFDWRYTGKVRECLDKVKERYENINDLLHDSLYIDDHVSQEQFGHVSQLRGSLIRFVGVDNTNPLDTLKHPILFIDTLVNNIRPFQLLLNFPESSKQSKLLPRVSYHDDTSNNLYTGCLLQRLFTFNHHLNTMNEAFLLNHNVAPENRCIVGLHLRFGDAVMFRHNNTSPEDALYDRRVDTDHPDNVIERAVACAASQALTHCHQLTNVGIFVATDSPQFIPSIERNLAAIQHRYSSIVEPKILMSNTSKPTHTSTFVDLDEQQRHLAEEELFRDYSMLALSNVIVATRSTFSHSAASYSLLYPISWDTCNVKW